MRGIIKGSLQGIGVAAFMFVMVSMIDDIIEGGKFALDNYQMTKMAIACIVCGIAWGAPSVIYNKENLSMPAKFCIHFGIAGVVYTIVAFFVGWLGNNTSLGQKAMILAIQIAIALAIWFCFRLYYKAEAKRLNDRIQAINKQA